MAETETETQSTDPAAFPLPRITIRFCTQCKWMLRAAYFAQELLSTFSTSLGEVALQPSTGGTFVVEIFFQTSPTPSATTTSSSTTPTTASPDSLSASLTSPSIQHRVLWDRKTDGGFPETKELKRRVRDAIAPGRDLGHVDRDHGKGRTEETRTGAGAGVGVGGSETREESQGKGKEGEEGAGTTARAEAVRSLGLNTHPAASVGRSTGDPEGESERRIARTQNQMETQTQNGECEDCR
ncbi:Rdx family-domain-containing protein [Hypoxylon sp. NC1633]|nr:Rdx family-domain-containing protein [Hypoxylon sp. NC1633]